MWWVVLGALAWSRPPQDGDADALAFRDVLERMSEVVGGLQDYTHRFYKQEWVDGEMTPLEVIDVKHRAPDDTYLLWVDGAHEGRELLYRGPSWNNGKFRVDPGTMFLPVVSLAPTHRMALAGNRHTLADLPMSKLVALVLRDAVRVNDHPEWVPDVQDLGVRDVRGERARCFVSTLPKAEDPTLYAEKVELCVNEATGLPNGIRNWDHADGALRLVEDYQYTGLQVNPGLSDADFDPEPYGL